MKRQGRVFMWLDNASDIDILFYEPYARIIADIAKNEQYNPLTVGVFGLWGAGKSTLLKLIGEKLKSQDGIICVTINAWMFESYDDAKTAIMEALLQELKEEVPVEETKKKYSEAQIKRFSNINERIKIGKMSSKFWKENPEKKNIMADKVSKSLTKYTIKQFTKDGKLVREWNRVKDIIKENPTYKVHNIYAVCSGEKPSMYGYVWTKCQIKI